MTALWTSADIAAATKGAASTDFAVTGVAFDSREVGPGDLFVALTGEATNGHRFLDQAFAQGASGAIVSEDCGYPHVRVADSFAALEDLARASRARTDAKIIGVTGSVGKTSAKEALYACLNRIWRGQAHRSVLSYNNHTGVPLSLSRMPATTRAAVLEMGMNHAGELAHLTTLVRPHVAVVTAIAPAHTEFFRDESAIADAKGEIFAGLSNGTAIVPFDSPHRDRLIVAATPYAARIVTFGSDKAADVRAVEAMRLPTGGSFVTARIGEKELSFTLSQPGAHWVSNALAVLAAVDAVGGDLGLAGLALADLGGLAGRGARFTATLPGGGEALVIDEAYNANPASMRATLAVLGEEAGRHVAVLGEMRELGDASADYHAGLAEPILAARVEAAVLVGEAMRPLAETLEGQIAIVHCADATAALVAARATIAPGDAVLVKGSNGVGLARVIAGLKGA
ncbi:UDP-N-acetylmuramoyl-tripeptide--D-alanyl-D-alanine ligase [Sphingomonas sp. Leaf343]|uniref:UDP-N-acetylmuramoyl-tripeptide--D-alanyl-D- alanine ligase n=1 Tax=Sphingomonas sp. Leaf343 TaxID=1736345 RepID=UPI0006F813BA|nr:UDP-N-acetylmuramoyl-tripeptide--D-alanyl-D-alanine ligase [Sphingomonas sp. Leaf343]KQR87853.1 UDP-N-acetylmuramoylalanyl-D-glutamyl-2, 6-diaminopimelate--D-alanyl-D-alanine ligase [Sphingomonas sp. Leaf343]